MYEYAATLKRVVDGDTVDLLIDLGLRVTVDARVRLHGLNAPEKNTPEGVTARGYVIAWFATRPKLVVRTEKDRGDKYGRWLARIAGQDGAVLNDDLVAGGYAVPWDGTGARPT